MEFVTDLLKLRILTAVKGVESLSGSGFVPADADQQQTQRVQKYFSLPDGAEPLATFLEPGRFGSIKYACLLTRTHLYASRIKTPIPLADIREVDWNYIERARYPAVSTESRCCTLLCAELNRDYLHDVLEGIRCALQLTRGAAAVFAAAVTARRDKTPLSEDPLAFAECTLDAHRLFAHARLCFLGRQDAKRGLEGLLLSADLGCADAQYALALFFHLNGAPGQNDAPSAAYWFARAAEQRHETAAHYLSVYSETTRSKGEAFWTPLRCHESLTRWAAGDTEERQRAAALCLSRSNRCLALALVLTDWGQNPDGHKATACLRAFEGLKEARAWLEYACILGLEELDDHRKQLADACCNTVMNDIIPELEGLDRADDAFRCRLWLAELGNVYCRATVARRFLEDRSLQREPMAGLQWLEWAFEGDSVHAPGICREAGIAYVTGTHLSPKAWRQPLPPSNRDRAIGFYLLERGRCTDALEQHLPTAPAELASLAAELDGFPFPFAAELADRYRAMADTAAKTF